MPVIHLHTVVHIIAISPPTMFLKLQFLLSSCSGLGCFFFSGVKGLCYELYLFKRFCRRLNNNTVQPLWFEAASLSKCVTCIRDLFYFWLLAASEARVPLSMLEALGDSSEFLAPGSGLPKC